VFPSVPPTEYGPHLWGIIKASLVNMGMSRFVRTNYHLWPVPCMDELGNMVVARRLQTREDLFAIDILSTQTQHYITDSVGR
jgi:hypothetical protein